ncbi:MAG: hypothetical protein Fur0037_28070 [Planctomycetota bacterium]
MGPRTKIQILGFVCLLAACGSSERGTARQGLSVLRTRPDFAAAELVHLNCEITAFFSAPVDPLSVTSETFAVRDASGHPVRGRIQVRKDSATFVPEVPLRPDLSDGSFRPDTAYTLTIRGFPGPIAVTSADGSMLESHFERRFRTLPADTTALGQPSPLRPVDGGTIPFLLVPVTGIALPEGNPRPRLRFTLPVLPSSVRLESFRVRRFRFGSFGRHRLQGIVPRSVRVCSDALDEYPGSSIEVDLGGELLLVEEQGFCRLEEGDIVVVELAGGAMALTDYARRPVQMPPGTASHSFRVVAGGSVPLFEWPSPASAAGDADALRPTFEVRPDQTLRPQVRTEAGDGSLGDFRPSRDVALRAGEPFDRGDGRLVTSRGGEFPFLSVDIPEGVTVSVDAGAVPVRLLSSGSIRIRGILELGSALTEPRPWTRSWDTAPVEELMSAAPVTIVCGGDLVIEGGIRAAKPVPQGRTALALLAAGSLELRGEIPEGTILAVEEEGRGKRLKGLDDSKSIHLTTRFHAGLPRGASLAASIATPWIRLPQEISSARLELAGWDPAIEVGVQQAVPDPLRPDRPDLRNERLSPIHWTGRDVVVRFPHGAFLRFLIQADLRGGEDLPTARRLLLWRE